MTIPALLALYDREMRRDRPSRPSEKMERDAHVSRAIIDVPGIAFGAVLWSELRGKDADAIIDAEIARFSAEGRSFEWKVYGHDEPSDLGDRLVRRGLRVGDPETLLCFDLSQAMTAQPPPGVTVRKLTRPDELRLLQLDEEPNEAMLYEMDKELRESPGSLSAWLATRDGEPIARGWMRYHDDRAFADLWGGRTVKSWRGRGAYKALVAARATEAVARGVRYLTTDALPTSRPILERMGFTALTTTTPYLWVPLT